MKILNIYSFTVEGSCVADEAVLDKKSNTVRLFYKFFRTQNLAGLQVDKI